MRKHPSFEDPSNRPERQVASQQKDIPPVESAVVAPEVPNPFTAQDDAPNETTIVESAVAVPEVPAPFAARDDTPNETTTVEPAVAATEAPAPFSAWDDAPDETTIVESAVAAPELPAPFAAQDDAPSETIPVESAVVASEVPAPTVARDYEPTTMNQSTDTNITMDDREDVCVHENRPSHLADYLRADIMEAQASQMPSSTNSCKVPPEALSVACQQLSCVSRPQTDNNDTAPSITPDPTAAFLQFCTETLDLESLTGDLFDRQLEALEMFWRNQPNVPAEPINPEERPRECPNSPTVAEFIGDEAMANDLVRSGLTTVDLVEWFATWPRVDKRMYLHVTLGKSLLEIEMIIRKIFRRLDCIENLI